MSDSAIAAFQRLADHMPDDIHVIIESPVQEDEIDVEVERVELALSPVPVRRAAG